MISRDTGRQFGRVGLLWRGDRRIGARSERADAVLGPLFDAFGELDVPNQRVVYSDDAADEVRNELLGLDGVLVWVNPIQDGANRAVLDAVLRDVSARGVWVSAHPEVILKMGTKEVLFHTRMLGWGTDTDPEDCSSRHRRTLDHRRGRLWKIPTHRATRRSGPALSVTGYPG